MGECSCLCVATVYVRLFIVSFRTINEKKVCFFLFIHNVQVSMNNNKQNMKKVTNSSGFLQIRRGSDGTAQSDALLYPARHVLLILTREFLITKHLINCLQSFRPPYLVVTSEKLLNSLIWSIAANCFTRSARQLGNPRVKSSLSRSAYGNINELKSSV